MAEFPAHGVQAGERLTAFGSGKGSLTLALGFGLLRCPTSSILGVVSQGEREKNEVPENIPGKNW